MGRRFAMVSAAVPFLLLIGSRSWAQPAGCPNASTSTCVKAESILLPSGKNLAEAIGDGDLSGDPVRAWLGQSLESLVGVPEGSLATVYYEFNDYVEAQDPDGLLVGDLLLYADEGPIWDQNGWRWWWSGTPYTAGTKPHIAMNNRDSGQSFQSALRFFFGGLSGTGQIYQLDKRWWVHTHSGDAPLANFFVPDRDIATSLDGKVLLAAYRVGFREDHPSDGTDCNGDWNHGAFIGQASPPQPYTADKVILDPATKLIAQPEQSSLWGWHARPDGSLWGISQRTIDTPYVEGTNETQVIGPGGLDGTIANGTLYDGGTLWFDLVASLEVTDWSDDQSNGQSRFWHRKVVPGLGSTQVPLIEHGTALPNQIPGESDDDDDLIFSLEGNHGVTAGCDGSFFLTKAAWAQTDLAFGSGMR